MICDSWLLATAGVSGNLSAYTKLHTCIDYSYTIMTIQYSVFTSHWRVPTTQSPPQLLETKKLNHLQ